jgi:hypothetical protein
MVLWLSNSANKNYLSFKFKDITRGPIIYHFKINLEIEEKIDWFLTIETGMIFWEVLKDTNGRYITVTSKSMFIERWVGSSALVRWHFSVVSLPQSDFILPF